MKRLEGEWTQYCVVLASSAEDRAASGQALSDWRLDNWDHPLSDATSWTWGGVKPDAPLSSVAKALRKGSAAGPHGPQVRRVFSVIVIGPLDLRDVVLESIVEAPWLEQMALTLEESDPDTSSILDALSRLMERLASEAGGLQERSVAAADIDGILSSSSAPPKENAGNGGFDVESDAPEASGSAPDPQPLYAEPPADLQKDLPPFGEHRSARMNEAAPLQRDDDPTPVIDISYPRGASAGVNDQEPEGALTIGEPWEAPTPQWRESILLVPEQPALPPMAPATPKGFRARLARFWNKMSSGESRHSAASGTRQTGLLLFCHALDGSTREWGERAGIVSGQLIHALRSADVDWHVGAVSAAETTTVVSAPQPVDRAKPWRPTETSLSFLLTDASTAISRIVHRYLEAEARRNVTFTKVVVVFYAGEHPLIDSASEGAYSHVLEIVSNVVWVVFGAQDTPSPELLDDPPSSVLLQDHDEVVGEIVYDVINGETERDADG